MARDNIILTSFTAGEVSPLLAGRVELDKYPHGCKVLENMIVLPHGGVTRSPGTVYVNEVKSSWKTTVLIPFEYSADDSFAIEVGEWYLRFYKNRGFVEDPGAPGTPYEIATIFNQSDLRTLRWVQSGDVMYIVSDQHPVQKLSRLADDSWTIESVYFPQKSRLIITGITQANPGVVTSTAHGLANGEIVYIEDVAGMVEVNDLYFTVANVAADTFELSAVDTTAYAAYQSGGFIEKAISDITQANPGVVTCVAHGMAVGDRVQFEDVSGMVEINGTIHTITAVTVDTFTIGSTFAMTAYTSGGRFTKVLFSDADNYPSVVAFFEERLVFGATVNDPQSLWFSVSGDYENFLMGDEADDAMEYIIKSTARIKWIMEDVDLVVGTTNGSWMVGGSGGDPLTPTNISAKRQSITPCSDVPPIQIGESMLFVQRFGMKIRELVRDYKKNDYSGGYSDADITVLSEHITRAATAADSGIIGMAVTTEPIPVVWMNLAGGDLIGLTFMKEQEVVGFHRHPRGNAIFESIVSIPGDTEDELWAVVKRTNGFGDETRDIEYFSHLDLGGFDHPHFVDCSVTWDGGASVDITGATQANPVVITSVAHPFSNGDKIRIMIVEGMTELNDLVYIVANKAANTFELKDLSSVDIDGTGFTAYTSGGTATKVAKVFLRPAALSAWWNVAEMRVYADGYDLEDVVQDGSGEFILDDYYNYVTIGFPLTWKIQPVRPEMGNVTKTSQGQLKKIDKIVLRLYKSMAGNIGGTVDTLDPIPYVSEEEVYTGDIMIGFWSEEGADAHIVLQDTGVLPFTLLSIIANGETFEGD